MSPMNSNWCIFQLVYQVWDIVTRCRPMATNALLNWQPGCAQCKRVQAYTHQQYIAQLVLPGLVQLGFKDQQFNVKNM